MQSYIVSYFNKGDIIATWSTSNIDNLLEIDIEYDYITIEVIKN